VIPAKKMTVERLYLFCSQCSLFWHLMQRRTENPPQWEPKNKTRCCEEGGKGAVGRERKYREEDNRHLGGPWSCQSQDTVDI